MLRILSILWIFTCTSLAPSSLALTVTTFNMLAPVHRSMPGDTSRRESEREDWWRPRAEFLAEYISSKAMSNSDVILLQEWWFSTQFEQILDYHTGRKFQRIAERRPGHDREDGMAVLVKRDGELEFVDSQPLLTDTNRIAQLVNCRHKDDGRPVAIANVHLPFPSSPDSIINERRQACQVQKVVRALSRQGQIQMEPQLQVLGGDFNSNSRGLAARSVEAQHGFVNCASAAAEQALSHTGGQVNLGVTHKQHDGLLVSVDHIFARMIEPPTFSNNKQKSENVLRGYGFLDSGGTQVVDCVRGDLELECPSHFLLSDHRPVTATLKWPSRDKQERILPLYRDFCNAPLDPLEPPSYMGGTNMTAVLSRVIVTPYPHLRP